MYLKANWKTQYFVSVVSPVGSPAGAGWYDQGSTAIVSLPSPVMQQGGTRQVFTGWNGTTNQQTSQTIVVSGPTMLSASWKTQYYIGVQSAYGNPQGSGWYDAGSQVPITIQPQVNYDNKTRRVFTGWSGDYAGKESSITMVADNPKSLAANWITQYQLSFSVIGIDNSTIIKLNIDNSTHDLSKSAQYSQWFTRGTRINPTVNETLVNGFLQFQLNGILNSTGGRVDPPITVNQPMDYSIAYQQSFPMLAVPGFPIESILIGLAIGYLSIFIFRRRTKRRCHA
jgi:hypothetical protein